MHNYPFDIISPLIAQSLDGGGCFIETYMYIFVLKFGWIDVYDWYPPDVIDHADVHDWRQPGTHMSDSH